MSSRYKVNLIELLLSLCLISSVNLFAQQGSASTILDVDYEKLISRADLHYDKQVRISEEGIN